jgi:hypothetical protein
MDVKPLRYGEVTEGSRERGVREQETTEDDGC